jgi:dephospho-CoA kinase
MGDAQFPGRRADVTVVGLIGPIAAGKGVAAEEFARQGAALIRADDVSREVVAPGSPTLQAVIREFGEQYRRPDGSLDRAALGKVVFADPAARRRLERIVHPPMVEAIRRRLAALREGSAPPAMAVVEAANLFEMGARSLVDLVVLVTAPAEVRLARLISRDGLTEAEARARLRTHDDLAIEDHPADFVLSNDASPAELRAQVQRLCTQIAAQGPPQK